MNEHFHLHYSRIPKGSLDSYARAVDEDEFRAAVCRVSGTSTWARVGARMNAFFDSFGARKPVRVQAAVLFNGEREDLELSMYDAIGRLEYEPLYGEEVRSLRAHLDERTRYCGAIPEVIASRVTAAAEDLRLARNLILHYVMTSTFRIVLTRRIVDDGGRPWLVISTRDTDRQNPSRIDVVAATEERSGRFVYYGDASMLPSSSLESAWTCHERLAAKLPVKAIGVLHCHALAALNLDRHARSKGLIIDQMLDNVQTVKGISRTPDFGEKLADAFVSGRRMCFRAGEGVWSAAATVESAAEGIVEALREIPPDLAGVLVAR